MSHTTFDNNTSELRETVTFLIISLKSEMLWGVGVLNNLQCALESVDGFRPSKV